MNASKERYGESDLADLLGGASEIVVARGKKVVTVDMRRDAPSGSELAALVLGPTGNLRAPAIRTGKTWLIGFHEEAFTEQFGQRP